MGRTENPSRDRILKRIQSALTTPAALRHSHAGGPIFGAIADPMERFQEECKANYTECVVAADLATSAKAVSEIVANLPPGELFVQDAPTLRRMVGASATPREVCWSGKGGPTETCQATITLAESLVAATGSVFVSAECGGRGASIVAPVHIVIATALQIVPTLATTFEWICSNGAAARNSMMSLITGPSRTGDIEKIIVLGAHGPRRLIVVLMLSDR